jgi:hypothetical protein
MRGKSREGERDAERRRLRSEVLRQMGRSGKVTDEKLRKTGAVARVLYIQKKKR